MTNLTKGGRGLENSNISLLTNKEAVMGPLMIHQIPSLSVSSQQLQLVAYKLVNIVLIKAAKIYKKIQLSSVK